jgi:hypothetical protein
MSDHKKIKEEKHQYQLLQNMINDIQATLYDCHYQKNIYLLYLAQKLPHYDYLKQQHDH